MANKEKMNGGALAIATLFTIGAAYSIDWQFLSDSKITHYELVCQGKMQGEACAGDWVQWGYTLYVVNPASQAVVSQTQGQPPQRLTSCAVVDKKNWKCKGSSGGSVWVGFTNGAYWDGFEVFEGVTPPPTNTPGFKSVSRLDYITAKEPKK
jgi:hypothetical protein